MLAGLARRGPLMVAVFFMAISFFAFMKLLSVADLSFAVPVTAASVALGNGAGAGDPQGKSNGAAMGRRILGGLRGRAAGDVTVESSSLQAPLRCYQLLAIIAALCHRRQPPTPNPEPSPVSILKPVYGRDPGFFQAIRTHALQQYPEFEILFGIRREDDPAVAELERLMREFPGVAMRMMLCTTPRPI